MKVRDFEYKENTFNGFGTCSLLVNGTVILFGGQNEKRQISVVSPFGVKRVNTLPFGFSDGRCALHNSTIYLCFSVEERQCHRT